MVIVVLLFKSLNWLLRITEDPPKWRRRGITPHIQIPSDMDMDRPIQLDTLTH